MPQNDPFLPKELGELGVAAWELPQAAIRQVDPHSHAEAQLCGLSAGLAVMETDKGSWLCPPGRCIWIPSGSVHALRSCGRISGWMLHLAASECRGLADQPQVLALSPLLKEIVRRVASWGLPAEETSDRRRLVEVLRDEIAGASQIALHLPMPEQPALKRLAARLAEAPDHAQTLAALAREVGTSERSLFRNFQHETGLTPGQWRQQVQVLRSLELLTDGASVTEAALETGYESTGAFTRAFRRIVGITPALYRRQQPLKPEKGTRPGRPKSG